MIGSKWVTYIRMLGKNNKTRYMLMHLTNHDAGRDLMKDCIWKVCPDGGFYARQTDDFRQEILVQPNPNLTPLRELVISALNEKPQRWSTLSVKVRETMWRIQHLNGVIRSLRKEGIIDGRKYDGRFVPINNPEIYIK